MKEWLDVLIIEDEPVVQRATERILGPEGIDIDQAFDAETAAAKLRQNRYKVVLSDLMLPGSSGFAMMELARAEEPATQVIMITGYATLEHAIQSFNLGAFDFIPKPFDVPELLGVVRRALRFFDNTRSRRAEGREPKGSAEAVGESRPQGRYFLGRHAWAALDAGGFATLGVAETFPRLLGDVEGVESLADYEYTVQGKRFLRILSRDELVYRVWAPLSGQIIAVNHRLEREPELLDSEPYSDGWLVRIIPASLEEELSSLTCR
jgi:CheY-like chemotaxis protein/glycine cleavage system H lipoate-binding protein